MATDKDLYMPAFSFFSPAILVMGISMSQSKTYEYLPMQTTEQCEVNISQLHNKGFVSGGYSVCLDTGFPVKTNNDYSQGENTRVPYWLIAAINNDYEYMAMNDQAHCQANLDKLVSQRFVSTGLFSSTPYAVCIATGFPSLK